MRLVGLVVSALLGVPVAVTPADLPGTESLTVSPSHGVWTAPFTITYTYTFAGYFDSLSCPRDQANFIMDQVVLGPVAEVKGTSACTATARVTLPGPSDPYDLVHTYKPGPHLIKGPSGLASSLTATYTIDPGPSPTARPSPTHAPAPARTTNRPASAGSAVPTTAAPAGPTVIPSASVEVPSDPPSASVQALGAAMAAPSGDASSGGTATTPWVVAAASVLVLGGGGLLGLLVLRRRRAQVGPAPDAGTPDI